MNKVAKLVLIGAVLGLLNTPGIRAEDDSSPPPAPPSPSSTSPSFNPQSVESITGQVLSVDTAQGPQKQGVHLQVKTERGTIPVLIGPSWFLEKQNIKIEPHDQVTVTGSRISILGKETIIASQITDKNQVFKFRDDNGRPLWAASGGPANARPDMGMSMTGRGSGNQSMPEGHHRMMEQHNKMLDQMKAMDAALDKKVAAMNQAQGEDKINAMADVINQLVKEREMMHQHMNSMQQGMMGRGGAMGAPGNENEPDTGSSHPDHHDHDSSGK